MFDELKTWATADELEHDEFTEQLQEEGLSLEELEAASKEFQFNRERYEPAQYYHNIAIPSIIEKETLDF